MHKMTFKMLSYVYLKFYTKKSGFIQIKYLIQINIQSSQSSCAKNGDANISAVYGCIKDLNKYIQC